MRITDDRYRRDRRALDLAYRMLGHGARTGTISRWTGLGERLIRRFQRSYAGECEGPRPKRPRGSSPYRIELLLDSSRTRKETIALARFLVSAGVLRVGDYMPVTRNVDSGEKLCLTFEAFRAEYADTTITIEQAALLITSISDGIEVELVACPRCQQITVIDRLNVTRQKCDDCDEVVDTCPKLTQKTQGRTNALPVAARTTCMRGPT
jgi:hypothetical protein